MAQSNAQKQLQQYDTDIAVLKVEFKNLDEKFDTALKDVRSDIKTNTDLIREGNASTHKMLIDFQKSNLAQWYYTQPDEASLILPGASDTGKPILNLYGNSRETESRESEPPRIHVSGSPLDSCDGRSKKSDLVQRSKYGLPVICFDL